MACSVPPCSSSCQPLHTKFQVARHSAAETHDQKCIALADDLHMDSVHDQDLHMHMPSSSDSVQDMHMLPVERHSATTEQWAEQNTRARIFSSSWLSKPIGVLGELMLMRECLEPFRKSLAAQLHIASEM